MGFDITKADVAFAHLRSRAFEFIRQEDIDGAIGALFLFTKTTGIHFTEEAALAWLRDHANNHPEILREDARPKPHVFAAGNVVQLRSGGPMMVIQKIDEYEGKRTAFCSWFVDNRLDHGNFNVSVLRLERA